MHRVSNVILFTDSKIQCNQCSLIYEKYKKYIKTLKITPMNPLLNELADITSESPNKLQIINTFNLYLIKTNLTSDSK